MYDPFYFGPLAAVEDRHFWFRARNRVIETVAGQIAGALPSGYRVLEVGCGNGNVLRVLEKAFPDGVVLGMDLFPEGLAFARQRTRCPLVCGDIGRPPFRTRFQVIGVFDVLEHLPADVEALRDLRRLLAPGGTLILTVPAHNSLWSYFDEESRHCRRYEEPELRSKLAETGYRVAYLTPYMTALYPLIWAERRLAALFDRRDARILTARELRVVPVVNGVLSLLLDPEIGFIARRRRLPAGASLLAVAVAGDATPSPR